LPHTRAQTLAWCREVDAGPWYGLAVPERITYTSHDWTVDLSAVAALTERVRLYTTIVILPAHDEVAVAKQLASIDVLSDGRLTVGVGVGGRHEDYHAVGADPGSQTRRGMADRVAIMRRVWAGEKVTESVLPVGPAPVQRGGPPLLVGTIGPKTLRGAASWADGLAGTTLDVDPDKQNDLFDVARLAWADAGKPVPYLATSFWFALGPAEQARDQVRTHLRRYMNWIPAEYVDAMAPGTGWSGSQDELAATLRAFEAIGTDEVHLIPTSSDLDQVRRVADVVEDFA